MKFPLPNDVIRAAFVEACLAELRALKPGNVHLHATGHGMEVAQFEEAARASAPSIANGTLKVGKRILRGVEASFAAAGCNTNLGILLLCAPLAAAAGAKSGPEKNLHMRLAEVLARLGVDDAEYAFRAIARANPAGLGKVADEDVAAPPTVTLREAMALAAGRDRIAHAYISDFEDVFLFGLPELEAARRHAISEEDAITTLHMAFLATFLDSHIARKHGATAAAYVRSSAREREELWRPAAGPASRDRLLEFDRQLKTEGLNPGTTADFVVATLFAATIIARTAGNRAR